MPTLETPMGLALVMCDSVIEDKLTGKKSLIGICDRIAARRFPCTHPELCVFVTLTSGRGEYPCEIVCRQTDTEKPAFAAKGKIRLREPSQVVDLVFRLRGIQFSKPGTFWLHFLADGVPIMMRPLFVQEIKPKQQRPAEDES